MTVKKLLNYFSSLDYRDKIHILAHVWQKNREHIIAHPQKQVSVVATCLYLYNCIRRTYDIPLAYILGSQPFFGLNFVVNKHTLIPRPESEWLVEKAVVAINQRPILRVFDIGTGSGAISLSIAKHAPNLTHIASDVSLGALKIARLNANKLGLKVKFEQSDLLKNLWPKYGPFTNQDLIVANLPYIPHPDYSALAPQVKAEPYTALVAGSDGLLYYRSLINQLKYAESTPYVILECDPSHITDLVTIIKNVLNPNYIESFNDINNLKRYIIFN